jgi:ribonucleoside-diphosphate reductase alpha chain
MDHPALSGQPAPWLPVEQNGLTLEVLLAELRQVAIDTNAEWAEKLGINPSTAITCVKPSGTVSQLVDAASGIHPRWSQYYVRTNRASQADPVANFLWSQGIPCEDELLHPDTTWVFSYPMKAPEGSITRHDVSALDQLRLWLVYAEHWCEHKPSITVYVREDEWLAVGAFVYEHFDRMSGVSFLPHSEHAYKQAPYQDITAEVYDQLVTEMPDSLDWSVLPSFEKEDTTEGMRELACTAGACELV